MATIRFKILRYWLQFRTIYIDTLLISGSASRYYMLVAMETGSQIFVIFISPIGQTVGGQVARLSLAPKPSFASYLTAKIRGV